MKYILELEEICRRSQGFCINSLASSIAQATHSNLDQQTSVQKDFATSRALRLRIWNLVNEAHLINMEKDFIKIKAVAESRGGCRSWKILSLKIPKSSNTRGSAIEQSERKNERIEVKALVRLIIFCLAI